MTSERNSGDEGLVVLHGLLPAGKVHGPGIWSQHDELGKREFCLLGDGGGSIEGLRTVTGQAKNE